MKNFLEWMRRGPAHSGTAEGKGSFAEAALRRDRPPRDPLPEGLHASIMEAVRRAGTVRPAAEGSTWLEWNWRPAFGLAAAVLIGAGVFFALRSEPEPKVVRAPEGGVVVLNDASEALVLGSEAPAGLSTAALAPLARELDLAREDLKNLGRFLLASAPYSP